MAYFKFLPAEITLDILIRLPAQTVLNCKLVCTTWRSLVLNPSFSKMHLYHLNHHPSANDSGKLSLLALTDGDNQTFHYFEYNENHDQSTTPIQNITRFNFALPFGCTGFLGSCNGLFCVSRRVDRDICIGNPITREYVVLPEITIDGQIDYSSSGFGYVSSTNEYKVVKIHVRMTQFAEVYVYTLGSGSGWRNVGKFNSRFFNICSWQQGVFAHGTLYWKDTKSERIVNFDLGEEKFGESLSPPPMPPDYIWHDQTIWGLDGFLSFVVHPLGQGDEFYDVWLLKEGEEHRSSGWTKEFSIDRSKSVAITKSNGVLTNSCNCINIYHTKTSTSKRLVKFKDYLRQLFPHKNTFVSLKELGEKDAKTMESVEIQEKKSQHSSFKQLQFIYL